MINMCLHVLKYLKVHFSYFLDLVCPLQYGVFYSGSFHDIKWQMKFIKVCAVERFLNSFLNNGLDARQEELILTNLI